MEPYVIGIDLGGTKVEACLLDKELRVMARRRILSQPSEGRNQVVENILRVVKETAQGKTYAAVGIGTPGTYNADEDRLYGAPHTPLYEEPGLIGDLRLKLDVPVVVENDANCLALAEFYASCKGKYGFVLAVILGTGVGGGLILDNRLYRGAKGGAGEIGHTIVELNGRQCQCGRRGCAEAYLSGPSLSRRYREQSGRTADAEEIYRRFLAGESSAVRLLEETCVIMADFFADAVNALDLEAVILGGGVSNIPLWVERVPPMMRKRLFGVPRPHIPLLPARLGDSAGVFGAAYLGLRELGLMDF